MLIKGTQKKNNVNVTNTAPITPNTVTTYNNDVGVPVVGAVGVGVGVC